MTSIRTPTESDRPSIIDLTRANRALLAELEPDFWRQSADADALHRAFVTFQIRNEALNKYVVERDDRVIGYAVCSSLPSGFNFVDDVCLSEDADWLTEGALLLRSIQQRPAIMTAPHRHTARIEAAKAIGLEHVSSVRSLRFDRGRQYSLDAAPVIPIAPPEDLVEPPVHVWQHVMAPESSTIVGDGRGGYVVISPAISAPPIYDPGGKVGVVDRVVGEDRQRLLMSALSFSFQRGDVGVILVVGEGDKALSAMADRLDARHPVDVFRWPD